MKEQLANMTIIELVRTAHSYAASIQTIETYSAIVTEMGSRLEALNLAHIATMNNLRSATSTNDNLTAENVALKDANDYIRNRFKEADLLFGKNILVMQAAIIEWRATSDAKKGMAWIFNTLFGPGELPDEDEKDAQAYFDRKYAPLDEELMALHKWFWDCQKRAEAERVVSTGVKV
ncbi:ead/Ea22-like family protein [Enterobacter sp.]|uniref:ead/Ea22-like family protein n=1 Tax=Enterobacter sp. TaxID=42895 RepID=UPI003996502F